MNAASQTAILYWDKFWIGGFRLSSTEHDASVSKYFYDLEMWPSNYRNDSWVALASRVNQPTPPPDLTRMIAPGASVEYGADVHLRFNKKDCSSCSEPFRDTVWKRIAAGETKMWLQLAVEAWPINLEEHPGHSNVLGENLRKKWRTFGVLQLENLVSVPTEIILPAEPTTAAVAR